MEKKCPNYHQCKLVSNKSFVDSQDNREMYLSVYCQSTKENWKKCRRYEIKKQMNFCPDFVMPTSVMTTDEVMDKFDELI